jgi:ABC-type transport system involved in cytochrome bd biosynthesis fused ATPase/permease subunit
MAAKADHVVVLDCGRVVEEGSPTALLAQNGLYRRLYDEQTHPDREDASAAAAEGRRARRGELPTRA